MNNQGALEMWMSLRALQKITKLMTRSLVQDMITCLNIFSSKNGISSNLSPSSSILGSSNPGYNKMRITFGACAQVYIRTNKSTKKRRVGAIALISENEHGGCYFMPLSNGKHLHGLIWTELPINYQVVYRLNYLAIKEKQP